MTFVTRPLPSRRNAIDGPRDEVTPAGVTVKAFPRRSVADTRPLVRSRTYTVPISGGQAEAVRIEHPARPEGTAIEVAVTEIRQRVVAIDRKLRGGPGARGEPGGGQRGEEGAAVLRLEVEDLLVAVGPHDGGEMGRCRGVVEVAEDQAATHGLTGPASEAERAVDGDPEIRQLEPPADSEVTARSVEAVVRPRTSIGTPATATARSW